MEKSSNKQELSARLIAFYLPQFHPIQENDEWWGKGFTEWNNVTRARPLYQGHYQPHLPADLGFYDLRLPEAREAQADLARSYGIHGFCYYHYWFNGKRLLERPFNEVLEAGKPDFPFCLCWANENWTRRWDGLESDILIRQQYNHQDDRNHIRFLLKPLADRRYIRINGRPLFLVYRAGLLPEPRATAEIWRDECHKAGIGDIFLASVESIGHRAPPSETGFDATVEFAPDWPLAGKSLNRTIPRRILQKLGLMRKQQFNVYSYDTLMENMMAKKAPDYKQFRCVTPSWDKTARQQSKAAIWEGSAPGKYERWLEFIVNQTVERFEPSERLVFINAWNEWAEGCHLEPDQRYGLEYLEATNRAMSKCSREH